MYNKRETLFCLQLVHLPAFIHSSETTPSENIAPSSHSSQIIEIPVDVKYQYTVNSLKNASVGMLSSKESLTTSNQINFDKIGGSSQSQSSYASAMSCKTITNQVDMSEAIVATSIECNDIDDGSTNLKSDEM